MRINGNSSQNKKTKVSRFKMLEKLKIRRFTALLSACLLLSTPPLLNSQELPYIESLLPQNEEEIHSFTEDYRELFERYIENYVESLQKREDPEAAILSFKKACSLTQVTLTKAWLIGDIYKEKEPGMLKASQDIYEAVSKLFRKTIAAPHVVEEVLLFCESRSKLSPDQVYFFSNFLSCFAQNPTYAKRIAEADAFFKELSQTPYIYKQNEKGKEPLGELTVFNANILFMPDNFTYYFGGTSPWQHRLENIIATIQKSNPHIVCLQEVHDVESAYALYEKLKDDYPYIYLDIGFRFDNLDEAKLKLNSGLFVASQYPLENVQFTPFSVEGMQEGINKGFFSATIVVNRKPLYRLVTTHLNPFENETAYKVRKIELEAILASSSELPTFVVGDFNIQLGSREYADLNFKQLFYDAYNKGSIEVSEANETCTEYFNDLVWKPLKSRTEIKRNSGQVLDYALWIGSEPPEASTETVRVPLYSLDDPTGALSDHQALMTTIIRF